MNLPIDYLNQMKEMLKEAYDAFVKEYDKPFYSALRVNRRKITPEDLCAIMPELASNYVNWEKNGIYYTAADDFRPGKSPFHEAGLYYIQEPSAMLPVTMLDLNEDNLKVLDLCAAPGGKTTQIADYMKGKGLLIANEIMPQRAKILSENIERMGCNAIVISADPRDIADRFEGFFDRILVDAPCSGEGMFRKHPEAMEEWSLQNVDICADRQSWILDCAAKMLKDGGKLVYSTCTFNMKEDEMSVRNFLDRNPDMKLSKEGMHRIFPHIDKGEGHFSALLCKQNGVRHCEENEHGVRPREIDVVRDAYNNTNKENKSGKKSGKKSGNKNIGGLQKGAGKSEINLFKEFMLDNFTQMGMDKLKIIEEDNIYILFGDNLYLSHKDCIPLDGVKVLRPGLHLGTILKGRFEPSHALALILEPDDVLRKCDFARSEAEIYLKGEAIRLTDIDNGYCLVCVEGYSLGWGKMTNGVLKNHYPKGLRWN